MAAVAQPETSAESQARIQEFASFALTDLGEDSMILMFSPVPSQMHDQWPMRILAPPPGSDVLNMNEVHSLVAHRRFILALCMLCAEEENKKAMRNIFRQLQSLKLEIYAAIILPSGVRPSREIATSVSCQEEELRTLGAHDILFNPAMRQGSVEAPLRVMRLTNQHHSTRMQSMLEEVPLSMTGEAFLELKAREQSLLWRTIPDALMPDFPQEDRTVLENSNEFAGYEIVGEFKCVAGKVLAASRKADPLTQLAVKVIQKSTVKGPSDLEYIYREIQLISEYLKHPNIVKYVETVHTAKTIYIVTEHAGKCNLEQLCEPQPGFRLNEDVVMDVFEQVVHALGYMHNHSFAHRQVCLTHVAVHQHGEDRYHCTLLDFRTTTRAQGDTTSRVLVGSMPFMAPEVALEDSYIIRHVDGWSVGMLLLEIAGGLGSMAHSIGVDDEQDAAECLQDVVNFFRQPNCHELALAKIGGVYSKEVIKYLEMLLLIEPKHRKPLPTLSESLSTGGEQEDNTCLFRP